MLIKWPLKIDQESIIRMGSTAASFINGESFSQEANPFRFILKSSL